MKRILYAMVVLAPLVFTSVFAGIPYIDHEANLENDRIDPSVTELMMACYRGNATKIAEIIKSGADVNKQTKWGETALMHAARYGKEDAVKVLLDNKADPNIQTSEGRNTALILAIYFANPDIVRLLLEGGADPNLLPDTRSTIGNPPALESAIEIGNIENVKLLLDYSANMRNSLGSAIANKRVDIINLLMKKGASVRRNIPTLIYTKSIATPEIKKLLKLDQYQLLGKSDQVYPDSLDEISGHGPYALARKLYTDPNYVLQPSATIETSITYLEATVIKNSIFARKGYAFDTIWMRRYFNKNYDTYNPATKNIALSKIDKQNLAYIKYLVKLGRDRK
jgi:ankyrin repeat protein